MPECERLETLGLLQQNRQEVEAKLSALPIIIETHSMVSGLGGGLHYVGGNAVERSHHPVSCGLSTRHIAFAGQKFIVPVSMGTIRASMVAARMHCRQHSVHC